MGGNDGLKGDMRSLQKMPSDALAAGTSIAGTGATPEGIDQNPAYYEYTFDTAWHAVPQKLDKWFTDYPTRRYGSYNSKAVKAWATLKDAVYSNPQARRRFQWHDHSGVEWRPDQKVPVTPTVDVKGVYEGWKLLVEAAGSGQEVQSETLNYDIVNAGREVLATFITESIYNITAAVKSKLKAEALRYGEALLEAYDDIDELVGCDSAFLMGPWIAAAKIWANASDAPPEYYEWQARSQVSTWWPVERSALQDPDTFK